MVENREAAMEEAAALHPSAAAVEVDTELEAEAPSPDAGALSSKPWRPRRLLRNGLLAGAGVLAAVALAASLRGARSGGALRARPTQSGGELIVAAEDHGADDGHHDVIPDQGMGFPVNTFQPTLFCWSVMNCQNPNEVETIKGQLRHRIGIFGCDNVAVISGCKMIIGEGHTFPNGSKVQVETWLNPAEPVPMGNLAAGDNTNSFKNSDIFIRAWNMLVKSKAVFGHDWIVKVDPDAVFFAYRARWHLKKYPLDRPAYIRNCNFRGQPTLFGAVEIVNEASMRKYDQLGQQCLNLDWWHWGEDQWIATCMLQKLGAQPIDDFALVGDHRCMDAGCGDTWRAGFHDYKSWSLYKTCWDTSKASEKAKVQAKKDAEKMREEGAFCCTFSPDPNNPCGSCGSQVKPGEGFCGNSEMNCKNCGTATWCKRVDGKAVKA